MVILFLLVVFAPLWLALYFIVSAIIHAGRK